MSADILIERSIKFSQIKIIKFFLQIFEAILFWRYSIIFKKKKKLNSKFFSFFQLFCTSKISALYRRKKHEILIETLDLNSEIDNKVYELTHKSYVKLFNASPLEVKSAVEHFYNQKIHTSHVPFNDILPNKIISVEEFLNTKDFNYGSFDIRASLNSSVVKKICSSELIWNIAKKYLQSSEIKIYSINTMLTKQSKSENYVTNLHYDFDCASKLTFFIYWTDVSKLNGATRLLQGSHLFLHDRRLASYTSESLLKYLEGKAGEIYALDTWALHSGNPNITSPRLVTWIRFSSMPAQSYYLDHSYLFKDSLNEINQKFGRSTTL